MNKQSKRLKELNEKLDRLISRSIKSLDEVNQILKKVRVSND